MPMQITQIFLKSLCLLSAVFAFVACKNNVSAPYQKVKVLAEEMAVLNCRLNMMQDSFDLMWVEMNQNLSENLPTTMKPDEIKNMLGVKNVPLIKMFESYQTFGDSLKQSLDIVEKTDREMVSRLHLVKNNLRALEDKKMLLFEKIHAEYPDLLDEYKSLFMAITQKKCTNESSQKSHQG